MSITNHEAVKNLKVFSGTWEAKLVNVSSTIAELTLTLSKSRFATKPSLFIPVVDRSGSMSGGPWRQVSF